MAPLLSSRLLHSWVACLLAECQSSKRLRVGSIPVPAGTRLICRSLKAHEDQLHHLHRQVDLQGRHRFLELQSRALRLHLLFPTAQQHP